MLFAHLFGVVSLEGVEDFTLFTFAFSFLNAKGERWEILKKQLK